MSSWNEETIVRSPKVTVWATKWTTKVGNDLTLKPVAGNTYDLTPHLQSYTWQKTIKTPSGGCVITLLPQTESYHFFETLDALDVIKIFEFDVLKFQGFIRRIGTSGEIQSSGQPRRNVVITATSFGGYLLETQVGVVMSSWQSEVPFLLAAENLIKTLADKGADKFLSFNELVTSLVDAWLAFITSATISPNFQLYIENHVDFSVGMPVGASPGFPKEFSAFYGNEDEINLWSIIQKLAESPINEFFFDEGPRTVHIAGINTELPQGKTYLIGRPTPFDGSVTSGVSTDRFKLMPRKTILLSHLLKYSFNKSMDEVYSMYLTAPAGFDLSKEEIMSDGYVFVDTVNFKKYVYRLCNFPLYYTKTQQAQLPGSPETNENVGIRNRASSVSQTLKNWYQYNDSYFSGVISYMVPTESRDDPRIGEKVSIEGLDGDFYVEGIAHKWGYQGALMGDATVTRGWSATGPIQLKGRLFKKAKFAAYGDRY